MELRDLLLCNYDCEVTIKPSTGTPYTWTEAFVSFIKANDLLQLRIGQQGGNGIKTFQLTKNIKDCFSWKGSIANKVTLKTLNPSTKLSLVFQTKEAEDTVGGLLKKIQYSQIDVTTPPSAKPTIEPTYTKKRKAVTYTSNPPVQKRLPAFTSIPFTPINNFDTIDEPKRKPNVTEKPKETEKSKEVEKPKHQKKSSNDRAIFQSLENKDDFTVRAPSRSPVRSPVRYNCDKTSATVTPPRRLPSPFKAQQNANGQSSQNTSPIRTLFKQKSPVSSARSSAGLSNLGNTCYVNSILQALLSLDSFCHALLNVNIDNPERVEGTLYQSLTKVLGLRLSNPHEMIEQDYLRECIARTSERFTKHQQEDSHEYLSMCINKLHHDIVDASQEFSDNCYEPEAKLCPVDDHFQCRVQSTLSCTQCSWKSTHYEIFRDLSLNLPDSSEWQCNDPNGVDIPTLLYQYFLRTQDEQVTYKCEECHCTEAVVQKKVSRPPRTLVLHLKRFTKDTFGDACRKRSDCVQVQPTLNLGPWCGSKVNIHQSSSSSLDTLPKSEETEAEIIPTQTTLSEQDVNKENGLRPLSELQKLAAAQYRRSGGALVEYQLQSVVSHHGTSIKRGHFVCDVRQENGWVCYNDSVCTQLGSVDNMVEKRKRDAYLLFYQLNPNSPSQ